MAKDSKKRARNRFLKDNHVGMKPFRHFATVQDWQEAVNKLEEKKKNV